MDLGLNQERDILRITYTRRNKEEKLTKLPAFAGWKGFPLFARLLITCPFLGFLKEV